MYVTVYQTTLSENEQTYVKTDKPNLKYKFKLNGNNRNSIILLGYKLLT